MNKGMARAPCSTRLVTKVAHELDPGAVITIIAIPSWWKRSQLSGSVAA